MPPHKKIDKLLKGQADKRYLDINDPFGNRSRIELGDPDKEAALALKLQEKAAAARVTIDLFNMILTS